ncbi:beta-ketoacyl-ACP synthase III [Brevibacillus fulvus]|uniref:Beta-ketoacyl-[acyl-carrier-protein] synthase III n=1 Tax=Brevibacillus fulvus TaxID=1125967 RepID=A0A938Y2V9_9BACL|nr:beta-ketoacyl-ACP synthase III [Brevibacillus fulvus]MBM7590976.1 3-oxoacyl-[acyl-carrier-protein] synthase-3 [Brevibacillus fulvus]
MYKAVISGVGSYLPERILTNQDLERMVETNDEWITTRTGISERRIAAETEATSDLAYQAAVAALQDAGLTATDLDMLIVATSTPDYQLPPVASLLQHRLGCRPISAFDVSVTCIGFISAMETASQYIQTGKHKHILVVGADALSRITDYADRTTCILFGDGAGAAILSRAEPSTDQGVIHASTHSAGEHFFSLYVPGTGSRQMMPEEAAKKGKIIMEGRKIFKLAVTSMSQTVKETLEASGYDQADLDWVIPHQANQRIIEAVAHNLELPLEKMVSTIKYYGNNSAATIPVAMDTAIRDGRIKRGDLVMLVAFGGGLVWGSLLLRY